MSQADSFDEAGLRLMAQKEIEKAITQFQQAIEIDSQNSTFQIHLANAYKILRNFDLAIEHYQAAIQINPQSAEALHNLATIYAIQNRYQEALSHYAKAVNQEPEFVLAHYNLGLLLLQHQETEAARLQFQNVVKLQPFHLEAHFYLGTLLLRENQLNDAEYHFMQVLAQNKEHVEALINLGVTLLKQGKSQLAIDYFTKALSFDSDNIEARNNIAATFIHHDRYENALVHYDLLLKKEPMNIEYLYNSGVAEMALGHLANARSHFEKVLTQNEHHFAALTNLAAIHSRLGEKSHAISLLQRAISINPNDASSQFMLNALTGKADTTQACPEYVSNLFDRYAMYYDNHLQNVLKYTIPQQMMQLLHQLIGLNKVQENVLDIGCGTGLMGAFLKELSKNLIGIDLSPKMIELARGKGIYSQLIQTDAISYLNHATASFQLIVAADVLPYFGELETLFTSIGRQLSTDGMFIFTTEISKDKPWKLQNTARFSHHETYIQQLCENNGLHILKQEKTIARIQDDQPLEVYLYCVHR